jgi:hypothetical protein
MKKVNVARLITSILLLATVPLIIGSVGQTLGLVENVPTFAFRFAAIVFAIGFIGGLTGATRARAAFADGFVISDETYAGEVAAQFAVKAITGAATINGGHVYVKDGIKKKYTIPKWDADYTTLIQDRAATPITKGSFSVTGNVLDPQDYMIYVEFNPRDFEDHWFATQLNDTLIDRRLPYTAESVTVQEVLKRHAKYLNKGIWQNKTTNSDIFKYWDGFLYRMANDSDVLDVSTPITLTASNVAGELERGFQKIPEALRFDIGMKYFVSYKTFDLYRQFQQTTQTYKGVDVTQEGVMRFNGREIVPIPDFPDDTYIIAKGMASPESNLWVGMNSMSDEGLKLAPLQANSELWFIKMLMKVDVNYGWGAEVVGYNL